jgi:hypothetical protein
MGKKSKRQRQTRQHTPNAAPHRQYLTEALRRRIDEKGRLLMDDINKRGRLDEAIRWAAEVKARQRLAELEARQRLAELEVRQRLAESEALRSARPITVEMVETVTTTTTTTTTTTRTMSATF